MMALVVAFAFVLGATRVPSYNLLRLPVDCGPIGASVEAADFDSRPFGKLAEEVVGEEAGDGEGEQQDLDDAALGQHDFAQIVLTPLLVGEWERPSSYRARARLGVVGARGPPLG